jgi:hypothetical protein
MGNSHKLSDMHIIGIVAHKGVVNVQELCRIINNRDFKWCHRLHEKYAHVDNRLDNQFVKQCKDCFVHYHDVYAQVMRMEREGLLFTEKRRYFDRKNDNGDLYKKRTDKFRFVFVDKQVYKKMILDNTLDGYKQ